MRRIIPLSLVLLAASATLVSADGIMLRWQDCAGDAGVQNRTFACDTNTGSHVLAASFVIGYPREHVLETSTVVTFGTASSTLPDWFRFVSPGSCRQGGISISAQNGASCPDMFEGQASMNIAAYQLRLTSPQTGRLLTVNAVQAQHEVTLLAGQEYGVARFTITSSKTVGTGSCAGCTVPACIVFNSMGFLAANNVAFGLRDEAFPGSSYVTWQGGAGANCPAATPTRNSTWGSVKSLYR